MSKRHRLTRRLAARPAISTFVGSSLLLVVGWLIAGAGWGIIVVIGIWIVALDVGRRYSRRDSAYRSRMSDLLRMQREAWTAAERPFAAQTVPVSAPVPPRFEESNRQLIASAVAIETLGHDPSDLAKRTQASLRARHQWESLVGHVTDDAITADEQRYRDALLDRQARLSENYKRANEAAEASLESLLTGLVQLDPPRLRKLEHQELVDSYRDYLGAVKAYHRADEEGEMDQALSAARDLSEKAERINQIENVIFGSS